MNLGPKRGSCLDSWLLSTHEESTAQGTRFGKKFLLSIGWGLHGRLKLRGMSGCVRDVKDVKVWSLVPAVWNFKFPWAWHWVSVWTGERKLEVLTVISFNLGAVIVKVPLCFFILRCWDVCLMKRWNSACMPALSVLLQTAGNEVYWTLTSDSMHMCHMNKKHSCGQRSKWWWRHSNTSAGLLVPVCSSTVLPSLPALSSSHICLADSLQ